MSDETTTRKRGGAHPPFGALPGWGAGQDWGAFFFDRLLSHLSGVVWPAACPDGRGAQLWTAHPR